MIQHTNYFREVCICGIILLEELIVVNHCKFILVLKLVAIIDKIDTPYCMVLILCCLAGVDVAVDGLDVGGLELDAVLW